MERWANLLAHPLKGGLGAAFSSNSHLMSSTSDLKQQRRLLGIWESGSHNAASCTTAPVRHHGTQGYLALWSVDSEVEASEDVLVRVGCEYARRINRAGWCLMRRGTTALQCPHQKACDEHLASGCSSPLSVCVCLSGGCGRVRTSTQLERQTIQDYTENNHDNDAKNAGNTVYRLGWWSGAVSLWCLARKGSSLGDGRS